MVQARNTQAIIQDRAEKTGFHVLQHEPRKRGLYDLYPTNFILNKLLN